MAYNSGFPMAYNQFYPQNFGQQPQQMMSQPQQAPQIQNGGFMVVPSEDIARTYPVAPGNCVTFKIEGKPIVMEKSMGFSQLEAPRINRYRLVREEGAPVEQAPKVENDWKDELKRVWDEIDVLKGEVAKATNPIKGEDLGA